MNAGVTLGRDQLGMLESLSVHDLWYENCGWMWSTPRTTDKIATQLVMKGLATATHRKALNRDDVIVYKVSKAGKMMLDLLKELRRTRMK